MGRKLILFFLFPFLLPCLVTAAPSSLQNSLDRVFANIQIHDDEAAVKEAKDALRIFPDSKALHQSYLQALAKAGQERLCFAEWKTYLNRFPEEKENHALLEMMCWGVISKGAESPSPLIRLVALLSAFFSQDAKGVQIVKKTLLDSHAGIRAIAIQLSIPLRDDCLKQVIFKLIREDRNWKVRLEAIKAAGSLQIKEAKPLLMEFAASCPTSSEEQIAAVEALVEFTEDASHQEIQALAKNPRAGLRRLACAICSSLFLEREKETLLFLLQDSSADVRAEALQALGLICKRPDRSLVRHVQPLLSDHNQTVTLLAAWVLTLHSEQEGIRAFHAFFQDPDLQMQRKAAAALSATGNFGLPLIQQLFHETKDPMVRLNLALGLVNQRQSMELASQAIYQAVSDTRERLMEDETFPFVLIVPSTLKHDELIPHIRAAVDQHLRLKLFNILAILQYPQVGQGIKQYLKEKQNGLSSLASGLLLTEGDEDALIIVKELLKEDDPELSVQAALILALWGGDEDALSHLEKAYEAADKEMREKILEGIGRIRSKKSIPFLAEKLQEPDLVLRLIAASSLLQALSS